MQPDAHADPAPRPDSEGASTPPTLKDLVNACLSRMEDEGDAALSALCAEHPDHAADLRRRIELLQRTGLVAEPAGEPAAATEELSEHEFPDRLGEYRLLRKIGAGGMGVVYLAEQESVGRQVALKLVRPELLYFERARSRFQREVESAGRLKHPGIVPIYAVGEEGGIPFFSMEYVEGLTLAEILHHLADRRVDELTGMDLARLLDVDPATASAVFGGSWIESCFRLMRQAAVAVEHAHQHGVLHRDLKPSNIMVTKDGRLVVLDFGLASVEGAGKLTRTGTHLGSLDYMSPEQIRGETESLDRRTDIYALGVSLYEMLSLRGPFAAKSEELVRARILDGRPGSIRALNRGVAWDAETVCLTAMDPDPARRYASAGDFARDLQNYLSLLPIEARRPGSWLRLRRWAQRSPARAVAATLGLLLVVGGPLGFAWLERDANRQIRSERDAAELSLKFAFDALQEMGTDLAQTELQNLPRGQELRKKVLQNTLKFYQRFLEARGDDPRVWSETARAFTRVAEIHYELGDVAASERAMSEAERLYDKILAQNPDAVTERYHLLADRQRRAGILADSGRHADAVPILRRVVAELDRLLQDHPDHEAAATLLSIALHNLSLIHDRLGEQEERDRCIERSIAVRSLADDPKPEHLAILGRSHVMQVYYLRRDGKLDEAEGVCLRALEVYERLAQQQPENASGREGLAEVYAERAFVHQARRRYDDAVTDFQTSLGLRRQLAEDYPTMPDRHHHLAGNLTNLANQQHKLGRYAEAKAAAMEARVHERMALDAFPDHAIYRRFMYNHTMALIWAHRALGEHQESAALCDELVPVAEDAGRGHYAAAGALTDCIPTCAADEDLSAAKRAELCESYGRSAVEHLVRARELEYGRFDPSESRFDPLRERPGFVEAFPEFAARSADGSAAGSAAESAAETAGRPKDG